MQKLARFILQGPVPAIALAGIFGGFAQMSFLFAVPCAAIVALFALRKSEPQGLSVMLGTALMASASGHWIESRPGFDYPVALLLLLPAYCGARALRPTESQGLAVITITVCAILFAFGVQLLTGDAEQWWHNWLKQALQGLPKTDEMDFDNTMPALNGVIALMLGIVSTACLFGARWTQATLFNPGGFEREFRNLSVAPWMLRLLLLAIPIGALINPTLLYDLLPIGTMPFLFQGLAVLQHTAEKKQSGNFVMSLPYVLLLLIPQIVIVGYACLGAADMFFNFRKLPRMKP